MQTTTNTKLEKKPLSSRVIEVMKPNDKTMIDSGENAGLRIKCGAAGTKTFFYRYKSPLTGKLVQIKIGNYPVVKLANARVQLQELKDIRRSGRCPANELRLQKQEAKKKAKYGLQGNGFTVKDMIELYLTQYIEDKVIGDKRVRGARKPKGQAEVRRTLYGDAVRVLGQRQASKIHRKDISSLIIEIVDRGAHVQAGNVLREFSSAFEFAIGMDMFDDNFSNPCVSAKASILKLGIRLTCQRRKRHLRNDELVELLRWLPGSAFTATQKNILRFTLWTGCRTGEVCVAEWKDINLEEGTWHLRATKTGTERYVQLPMQAINFLKQLKLTTGDYLFPSHTTRLPIQQKALTEQAWHLRKTNDLKQHGLLLSMRPMV